MSLIGSIVLLGFILFIVLMPVVAVVATVSEQRTKQKQIEAQMAQAELERQRQIYAQNNYVAAQAAEQQKSLAWVCASCGANNFNREVCEFCGAGKPN